VSSFAGKTELESERNPSFNQSIQGVDRLCLLWIGLFSKVEGTHESHKTNPSLFVAGASSTLFPSSK
jgi:hypothetical protein